MTSPADLSLVDGELSDDERLFDELIANEQRIEPRDWMPDAYRKTPVSYTHLTLPTKA